MQQNNSVSFKLKKYGKLWKKSYYDKRRKKENQIVKAMEIVKNKIEKHKDVFIRLKDK